MVAVIVLNGAEHLVFFFPSAVIVISTKYRQNRSIVRYGFYVPKALKNQYEEWIFIPLYFICDFL